MTAAAAAIVPTTARAIVPRRIQGDEEELVEGLFMAGEVCHRKE